MPRLIKRADTRTVLGCETGGSCLTASAVPGNVHQNGSPRYLHHHRLPQQMFSAEAVTVSNSPSEASDGANIGI